MTLIYFIVFSLGAEIQNLLKCLCRFKLHNIHLLWVYYISVVVCIVCFVLDHLGVKDRVSV